LWGDAISGGDAEGRNVKKIMGIIRDYALGT
jgi:hypothetical protein